MAVLSTILNKVDCTFADLLGGGELGCGFDFGNLKHVRFWKRGYNIPAATDYNRAFLRTAQQAGNLVVIMNDLYDFTWNIGEDSREQAESTGLSSTTRKGIYALNFKRRKGLYDQKVLNALDGGNFDVQLIDINGNELMTQTSSGGFKGFTTSMIAVDPIMFANGTTSQKTGMTIEFSNAAQFNKSLTWITAPELDYLPEEVTGANQVSLSIPTAPSDTDTTFSVKTVLARGGEFVSNLVVGNFLVKVAGATVTPSNVAADATNNAYIFTVAALSTGQAIEVNMYDTGNATSIVITNPGADDVVYKSNTTTTSVV